MGDVERRSDFGVQRSIRHIDIGISGEGLPPTLDWFEHGFKGGREGTLWYYRAIAEAVARLLPGRLANELTIAVAAMEQLSRA